MAAYNKFVADVAPEAAGFQKKQQAAAAKHVRLSKDSNARVLCIVQSRLWPSERSGRPLGHIYKSSRPLPAGAPAVAVSFCKSKPSFVVCNALAKRCGCHAWSVAAAVLSCELRTAAISQAVAIAERYTLMTVAEYRRPRLETPR